jgi:hypothetical protein
MTDDVFIQQKSAKKVEEGRPKLAEIDEKSSSSPSDSD